MKNNFLLFQVIFIITLAFLPIFGCGGGDGSTGTASGGGTTGSVSSPVPVSSSVGSSEIIAMENNVKTLIDNERAKYGKPPLSWNETLRTVARNHSQDMITRNFFSHTNPDGLGPSERVTNAGINYLAVAENIAYNQGQTDPAQTAVTGWMNSEGHKNNIIDANNYGFTETGVGIAVKSDGTYYFTQLFLKPR